MTSPLPGVPKRRRRKGEMSRADEKLLRGLFVEMMTNEFKAARTDPDRLEWRMETGLGALRVSIHDDSPWATMFTRFEDVERARGFLRAYNGNDYSGKWNHHLGNNVSVQDAIDSFRWWLDKARCAS